MRALIAAVMPAAGDRIDRFEPYLEAACTRFRITSDLALAMFLAQIAHESAELRYVRELASGAAYEGRKDLGNTEPGDGPRFRGRGLIQITGRDNYRRCGVALGLDLLARPELLEEPRWAALSAGWFWAANGLTALAEGPDALERCTRRINGGLNGLADRRRYYNRALVAIAQTAQTEPATEPPTPQQIADSPQSIPVEAEPMTPFIAAALPALVQQIPELIRSFGTGAVTERNAKAAEAVLQIAQQATNTPNAQAAIEAIQSDPAALQATRTALEREMWFEATEAGGGGIDGARRADAKFVAEGRDVSDSPAFIISCLLLIFPAMLLVDAFFVHADAYDGNLRTQIVTGVLMVISMVGAFYLGSSFARRER